MTLLNNRAVNIIAIESVKKVIVIMVTGVITLVQHLIINKIIEFRLKLQTFAFKFSL